MAKEKTRKKGETSAMAAPRLAVLIDAENVPALLWPRIQALLPRLGVPAVVRAYTCGTPNRWAEVKDVAVVDAGAVVRGPNAADFLLAFDAGQLAHARAADEFVIVSGDDGFAVLVKTLKDAGFPTHAVIPCPGGSYGCRVAQNADVAFLIPGAHDLVATPGVGDVPPLERLFGILKQCRADAEGWVSLAEYGSALGQQGVTVFKGKLFDSLSALPAFELRGTAGAGAAVRRRAA